MSFAGPCRDGGVCAAADAVLCHACAGPCRGVYVIRVLTPSAFGFARRALLRCHARSSTWPGQNPKETDGSKPADASELEAKRAPGQEAQYSTGSTGSACTRDRALPFAFVCWLGDHVASHYINCASVLGWADASLLSRQTKNEVDDKNIKEAGRFPASQPLGVQRSTSILISCQQFRVQASYYT